MNNARIWTIVNPSVGVPLFFIGVMVTAFFVHIQLAANTTWFGNYWQGAAEKPMAEMQVDDPTAPVVAQAKD